MKQNIGIGLVGLGVVAGGVAKVLMDKAEVLAEAGRIIEAPARRVEVDCRLPSLSAVPLCQPRTRLAQPSQKRIFQIMGARASRIRGVPQGKRE